MAINESSNHDHGAAVRGESTAGGTGVLGQSKRGRGVHGVSVTSTGVNGVSNEGQGVHGVSETRSGVFGQSKRGRGVHGVSETHIGVHGKGGRLAGFFEGDVDITGNLTIQGVSIQTWLGRIVQLERDVAQLRGLRSSGGTSAGGGAATQAFVAADIVFDPQGNRILSIGGSGFAPREAVNLRIFYRPPGAADYDAAYQNVDLVADTAGKIGYSFGVRCVVGASTPATWKAQARGGTSGREAVDAASCP